MKKALIIMGIILLVLVLLVAAAIPILKRGMQDSFMENMKNAQVEKQYDLETSTSERIPLKIAQFESSIAQLPDARYDELETMLKNATVAGIQANYKNNKLTCEELVLYYLRSIARYDVDQLNSILELNPDALTLARASDKNKNAGKLGGIPVLLKANIATADKMATHAGAAALKDYYAKEDAVLVAKLRQEGAIILGKTNLSEWANYMAFDAPNGYSAIGGQTHNPYGKFDVGGSSSGAAAAIAADFAVISIGTETSGSIIYPSAQNCVLGLRPTTGLVSRTGIIPITMAMDTAGVIAHNAQDIALALDVISGKDANDSMTFNVPQGRQTDLERLNPQEKSAVFVFYGMTKTEEKQLKQVKKELSKLGMGTTTGKLSSRDLQDLQVNRVLNAGFQFDLREFLDDAQPKKIKSLQDIVDFNQADMENRAPFGQEHLEQSMQNSMTRIEWQSMVDNNVRYSRQLLDQLFEKGTWIVSFKNAISAVYSAAGYPAITIPVGYGDDGEPMAMTVIAKANQEADLLEFAKWYGENTTHVQKPDLIENPQ